MDRLYVSYEKYRRMIAEKKILHRMAVRSTSMQISAVLVTLAM